MFEIHHDEIDEAYTTRDAYNDIYSGEGILHRDSLYLWLINLLKPQPGKILMDIACGEGRLVTLAQQKGLCAIGTDFAIEGIRQGIQESPQSGWFVADGEGLPVREGCIDYITHVGSLEHYQNPLQGAKEIARLLHPNGKACILLPNAFGLFGNIAYAARYGDIFDDGQPLQRYGTRRTWERLLQSAGLQVEAVHGYAEVLLPETRKDLVWMLKHPQKIARYLITRFVPLNLSNHFVFICSRSH